MGTFKEFAIAEARPLPVIVLADASGSMNADGKLVALNNAIAEMIRTFADEDDGMAEIHVAVIAFGGVSATIHIPLTCATDVKWIDLTATGRTPLGSAYDLARELIEDRNTVSSRAYRPTIVLVSDGVPTDDWQPALEALKVSGRASKASRFAMGVGSEVEPEVLKAFLGSDHSRVFQAHEAREIRKFFNWVTMSVAARSRSTSPNAFVDLGMPDLDDLEF